MPVVVVFRSKHGLVRLLGNLLANFFGSGNQASRSHPANTIIGDATIRHCEDFLSLIHKGQRMFQEDTRSGKPTVASLDPNTNSHRSGNENQNGELDDIRKLNVRRLYKKLSQKKHQEKQSKSCTDTHDVRNNLPSLLEVPRVTQFIHHAPLPNSYVIFTATVAELVSVPINQKAHSDHGFVPASSTPLETSASSAW